MKSVDGFIDGFMGLMVALLFFVSLFPTIIEGVVTLKGNGNLSTGEKAMVGIIIFVVIAGVVLWVWNSMKSRKGR